MVLYHRKLVMKDAESFIDEGQHSGNAWEWQYAPSPAARRSPRRPPVLHCSAAHASSGGSRACALRSQDYGYWYHDSQRLYPNLASCMVATDRGPAGNGCAPLLAVARQGAGSRG
eukprot:COSAG04_NODE_7228_length_1164_cov_1.667606_1_plen_114_part_10